MVRTKISKDRLSFYNVYITDQPLRNNKIQGNVVKSFEKKSEAQKWLKKWKATYSK